MGKGLQPGARHRADTGRGGWTVSCQLPQGGAVQCWRRRGWDGSRDAASADGRRDGGGVYIEEQVGL